MEKFLKWFATGQCTSANYVYHIHRPISKDRSISHYVLYAVDSTIAVQDASFDIVGKTL